MKFILIPLIWLMVPFAFVVVIFEVAKAFVEDKIETVLRSKTT